MDDEQCNLNKDEQKKIICFLDVIYEHAETELNFCEKFWGKFAVKMVKRR